MAKKSMIAREIKRQKTVERFAAKRAELKKSLLILNLLMKISLLLERNCKNFQEMQIQFVFKEDVK